MKKLIVLPALFCFAAVALADEQYDAPHRRDSDAPPRARQYAPDRDLGFLHMALDITPDFKERTIAGVVSYTFKPIAKPPTEVTLDAGDMSIQSVESSEKIQAWQMTSDSLVITFADAVPTNKEATVTIKYSAEPKKGLYFRTPEMGYKPGDEHLFTQGEAIDNRYWYPSPDAPNEKFTTEITCHVPEGMTVFSNGRLVGSDKDAAGLMAFHWSQEKPHANYLVALDAGYFKGVEDKHDDTPIALYAPASDINEVPNSFRDTKDIMDFYEHDIGVHFPWAKYYQVIVQDFMEGGMENTSVTTLTESTLFTPATENLRDSQGLIAHEMAHQWFGDLVTCKDWSHIWLNEGFATFYALLYDGHKNGNDSMLYGFYRDARRITMLTNETRSIVDRNFDHPDDVFGLLAYQKGSMVLRMLRCELGDDLYRRCIQTYLARHQYGNVETGDLSSVIEELSGRSWDQFFDQWVYHAHFPELEASYTWDEGSKLAKISIQQVQAVNDNVLLFNFPLTVAFLGKSGRVEKTMDVKDASGDFYFPLADAPDCVLLDPHMELLAKINFEVPPPMLEAQLADKDDVIARLRAVAALRERKDKGSVAKLKRVLNSDTFYGVRIDAATALSFMHSDESLDALISSRDQSDARVRGAVAAGIAKFYKPTAFKAEIKALESEKNPDIEADDVRGLANYPYPEVHDLLVPLLQSQTYHNTLASSAIIAMRAQDNPAYIAPIRETLEKRGNDFTSRGFASGLDALAYIAREQDKKDDVRQFITPFVNDKNEVIRLGAIRALGTLEDPQAMPVLETFANSSKESPEQQAATTAMQGVRSARRNSDNLKELRDSVLDLQKEVRRLRKELDSMQDKQQAKPGSKPSAKGRRSGGPRASQSD